mgnify:CR=1 FL=1
MRKIVRKTYKECQKLIHSMRPHCKTVNEIHVKKLKLQSFERRLDLFYRKVREKMCCISVVEQIDARH